MSVYAKIRKEINDLAAKIKSLKAQRKDNGSSWSLASDIYQAKYKARHYNIAWSELRGKTRDQIEKKCNVKPNEDYVTKLKENWSKEIEAYEVQKALCNPET